MNTEQRQVAANLWTKPTDLSHHKPACRWLGNYIYHCHLLLLSPNADTQLLILQLAADICHITLRADNVPHQPCEYNSNYLRQEVLWIWHEMIPVLWHENGL